MSGTQMQLEDWLDDLCVRFIINLPQEDLSSVARICFQVEEAQWFYEDFIRPLDPNLPSMTLRTFCLRMFQHCPLLASFSVETSTRAFEEFLQYKTRVPVRGAIMLNDAMDSTVLVKGWKKGANWSFPRGKINKDEDDLDCAVREVWEETGLDLKAAGLVPTEAKPKYIEINMREQQLRLYVFKNVPMDTVFAPQTRKEISKIEWYKLSELPAFRRKGGPDENAASNNANKFYMVAPFLVPLKKWVIAQKKQEARRAGNAPQPGALPQVDDTVTEDDAWIHYDQPRHQGRTGPASGALESATSELQRLLQVQPATQGTQPGVPAGDVNKGTALLSLLQANHVAAPQAQQPAMYSHENQQPHTPMGQIQSHPPMPPNPYHHSNQQRMPSNAPQHMMPVTQNFTQNFDPALRQHPGTSGRPPAATGFGGLHYSQTNPLVQTQQGQLMADGHPHMSTQHMPPLQSQGGSFNRVQPQPSPQGSPVHILQRQAPAQAQGQQQQGGLRPLSNQGMALLKAFKSPSQPPAQPVQSHESVQQSQPVSQVPSGATTFSPPASIPAPHMYAPQPSRQALPSISPKELSGVGSIPQAPQKTLHQNALLGMFKEAPGQPIFPPVRSSANHPEQARTDQSMASALNQMSFNDNGTHFVAGQTPRVNQPQPIHQSPQPPRILKRGQDINSLAPHASPHSQASPSLAPAHSSPIAKSPQQKQQLLSLFGKPGGTPLAMGHPQIAPPPISEEPTRSQIASLAPSVSNTSRRGSETPISPADQSFLLGYLQSVTNNASAR